MSVSTEQIARAAAILQAGGLVAFPTETVYGLGADAENPAAVARIFAAKGRPSNHPLIVHLAPEADAAYWAHSIPPEARRLIELFWPGPLTLILPRAGHIPAAVAGGQDTIGLRCPAHPVAQALLREFKQGRGGIAAPSANKFGHVSPTTAQHVLDEFGSGPGSPVGCVLDGGPSQVGIESTILDLSRVAERGPVLLRPGQVGAERIAEALGAMPRQPDAAAPRAPGTLEAHYAPRTPLVLLDGRELAAVLRQLHAAGRQAAVLHHSAGAAAEASARLALPADAGQYAQRLYAAMRELDQAGAAVILVEAPPAGAAWQGVNDRLRRAAFDFRQTLEHLLH